MTGDGPDFWQGQAEVARIQTAGQHTVFCRLVLKAPEVARRAVPGQFVHVLCPSGVEAAGPDGEAGDLGTPGRPFLRRPISLHDVDLASGTITVLFRAVGRGTANLARVRPGDGVNLMGPLGGGVFPLVEDRPTIVCGGGIGVAPLLFLVKRLVDHAARRDGAAVSVLLGIRSEDDLALIEPFRELTGGVELEVASETECPGTTTGLVTDLLETALKRASLRWARRPAIYACGPLPMLMAVRRLVERVGAPAWFSVEERMACGVGACRGCAVAVRESPPFRLACVDGPVFEAGRLSLGEDGGGPSAPKAADRGGSP